MKRLLVGLSLLLVAVGLPGAATGVAVAATPTAGQSSYVPLSPVRVLDTRYGTGGRSGPLGAGQTYDLDVPVPQGATSVVLNVTATGATANTFVQLYPPGPPPPASNLNVVRGVTVANLVTVRVDVDGLVRLRNQAGAVHLVADLAGYTTATTTTTAGGRSTLVTRAPRRLLDTRPTRTPVGPGGQRRLDVRFAADGSRSGVPDDATAVVLNVTAVGPTLSTDIRVYPTGTTPVPTVSNLNPPAGRTVPNLVVVRVGLASSVTLRNQAGTVDLLADLAGWYVGTDAGAAFHPVTPVRLTDTRQGAGTPIGPGGVLDVRVAGDGTNVPPMASAVFLNVTAVAASSSTEVRVYPTGPGSPPTVSNLNLVRGQTAPNAVLVPVGRDGRVRLRNNAGEVDLLVDLAGWYAPTGDGWDVSWPQCTTAGATTSRLPVGGAFAVVGLTRGAPFIPNECFASQWQWASSLPGEPSVYLNTDAPGVRDSDGGRVWGEVCGTGTPTSTCGNAYGVRLAQYALDRLPTAPGGGRPMVWMDVEGPYPNGPFWQVGYDAAAAVNRAVHVGAVTTLREAGYRVGVYTDRKDSTSNDWEQIMGGFSLLRTQNWQFRAGVGETAAQMCAKDISATGGASVMVQLQPNATGQAFDVDHLC